MCAQVLHGFWFPARDWVSLCAIAVYAADSALVSSHAGVLTVTPENTIDIIIEGGSSSVNLNDELSNRKFIV